MADPASLLELAKQLDLVFQNTLDRLEAQTRDAIIIDRALRQLLEQSETDESIINWDPERAISPKLAFRSLALRLIREADKAITRTSAISPMDYEDLLSWADEPRRRTGSATEDFLKRIEYARAKKLIAFWAQFQARIAPDRDPIQAQIHAIGDLLQSFAHELPNEFVIPCSKISTELTIVPMALHRGDEDLEWVVKSESLNNVAKANHALATICQLQQQPLLASLILEMNATFHSKLRTSFMQYSPDEQFLAGGIMSMRMKRDHIDYRMSNQLFAIIRTTMAPIRGLHFVNAPKLN